MTIYYHGGVRDLNPGDLILPPDETGAVSIADVGAPTDEMSVKVAQVHRKDRVYLSVNPRVAITRTADGMRCRAGHVRKRRVLLGGFVASGGETHELCRTRVLCKDGRDDKRAPTGAQTPPRP